MRRRKAWTPSVDDRRALTEHLFHEVQMTFFLAGQIGANGARADASLLNGQLEAFTIHLRQLVEFFWGDRARDEDRSRAYAADFFAAGEWAALRPPMPRILEGLCDQPGIARLAYHDDWRPVADTLWDAVPRAFALANAIDCFVDHVDQSQLKPGYAHGMRMCTELLEPRSRAA